MIFTRSIFCVDGITSRSPFAFYTVLPSLPPHGLRAQSSSACRAGRRTYTACNVIFQHVSGLGTQKVRAPRTCGRCVREVARGKKCVVALLERIAVLVKMLNLAVVRCRRELDVSGQRQPRLCPRRR